ncbi:MAG TPA: NUDIX domain-containing protein [bacterium]|nr:NUDIX domain-containing protein [bacterium]HPJ72534.1 NUDIX domain-containing protein [bacterium]HPQ65874.1 NUDIX domain-containing protein [bacterium]
MSAPITLVTCGIIWKGNRFLIAQRKPDSRLEPLKWEFPGGKIEFTEDPPTALRREIREELGFEIDVGDIFCVSSHTYSRPDGTAKHIMMLAYNCAYRRGEPSAIDVHGFRWVETRELDAYDLAAADLVIRDRLQRRHGLPPSDAPAPDETPDLHDRDTTVADLRKVVSQFVEERDWGQFHSPKNLSMSIAIEAAELMELFQWNTVEESRLIGQTPERYEEVCREVADIAAYVLSLANSLDIDLSRAVTRKMRLNRLKYPREKFYGKF